MTLASIINRDDIVGGEIETHENGNVFRGPISGVKAMYGNIHFESPWMAQRNIHAQENWKLWPTTSCSVGMDNVLEEMDDGRILYFRLKGLVIDSNGVAGLSRMTHDFGVIFLKGGSKLDPAKVEGLVLP